MREVHLVANESTATSLVFRAADSEEEFFLVVDDSLLEVLTSPDDLYHLPAFQHAPREIPPAPELQALTEAPAEPEDDTELPEPESAVIEHESEESPTETPPAPRTGGKHAKQPDPQLSAPLTMRPREIQDRIRRGASLADLASEMGVPVSRIEPFAHPVLADRASVAQQAKQAHPVREDGPAKLTLWEVLATAFAARGLDLTTSEWDAYRDPAHQWVVKVTWQSGISYNTAEWTFHRKTGSTTVVARDANAADLIDPNFAQPVRSLSRVNTPPSSVEDTRDDLPVISDEEAFDDAPAAAAGSAPRPQRPSGAEQPSRRRRKAVTPGWEDILLGVRPSAKRSTTRDES